MYSHASAEQTTAGLPSNPWLRIQVATALSSATRWAAGLGRHHPIFRDGAPQTLRPPYRGPGRQGGCVRRIAGPAGKTSPWRVWRSFTSAPRNPCERSGGLPVRFGKKRRAGRG
jgi:hypothetical protein